MKIKCVSNIDYNGDVYGYLTPSKYYECVIDDEGDLLKDFLHDPCHGKYEVIYD